MHSLFIIFFSCTMYLTTKTQPSDSLDISGGWALTSSTPRGSRTVDLMITHDGSSATARTKEEEFIIRISGNKVSFSRELSSPMGKMILDYEGTVSANSMEGTSKMSSGPMEGREMSWTAKKKENE